MESRLSLSLSFTRVVIYPLVSSWIEKQRPRCWLNLKFALQHFCTRSYHPQHWIHRLYSRSAAPPPVRWNKQKFYPTFLLLSLIKKFYFLRTIHFQKSQVFTKTRLVPKNVFDDGRTQYIFIIWVFPSDKLIWACLSSFQSLENFYKTVHCKCQWPVLSNLS